MALLKYCILLVLYMFTFITCAEIEDICKTATILEDDGTRRRSCSYSTRKCDRYLMPGWYRVQLASTGEDLMMPTEPPTIDSCGTHYPIWLDGEHPLVADGIVDRIACSRYINTTCYTKNPIKIKNCTSHMVYHLVRAKGCNERYCFENDNDSDGKCGPASQSNLTTTATPTAAPITAQSKSTTMLSSSTTAPKTSTTPPGTSTITPVTTTERPTTTPVATTTPATTVTTTTSATTVTTTIFNNRLANNGNGRINQYISENIELSDKDDDVVSISAFIGMAALSIILIVVVGLLILYLIIKKRKRNRGNLEKYIIFEPTLDQNCKKI